MHKKILTNEERNRLVDAYGRMRKAKILAEAYDVSERTVFRLVAQKIVKAVSNFKLPNVAESPKFPKMIYRK